MSFGHHHSYFQYPQQSQSAPAQRPVHQAAANQSRRVINDPFSAPEPAPTPKAAPVKKKKRKKTGKAPHKVWIAHGETVHAFVIRPWMLTIAAAVGLFLCGWYFIGTAYLIYRDDILGAAIARQMRMQHAYEDRIASMRSQLDRISSRQLLDQEAFEAKLDQLKKRQAGLDQRQYALTQVFDQAKKMNVAGLPGLAEPETIANTETSHVVHITPQSQSEALRVSRALPSTMDRLAFNDKVTKLEKTMKDIQGSLDKQERTQVEALNKLEEKAEGRARRMRQALNDLGDIGRGLAEKNGIGRDIGGPFIPVAKGAVPLALESQLQRIQRSFQVVGKLERVLLGIPLKAPVKNAEVSSYFGTRVDPFYGSMALHAGIDFRAPTGHPAYATASGTVVTAGWSGGYGNLVEIDHGNGYSTRFGHLSAIVVKEGQTVQAGTMVGRVGSTGRSTGPHLHYEVRINDNATDPLRFLKAGMRLVR